jgi:hypothetical protein
MAINCFILAASASVGRRIVASPRDLTNTRVDVKSGDSVEVVFPLPSGFLALSDPLSFLVSVATDCPTSVSRDAARPPSALIDVPANSRVELTALDSGRFVITTGYRSPDCCLSLAPLDGADLPFRGRSGACHVPLSSAGAGSIRSDAAKQFAMAAARTRILRGRYAVDAGDYVNVFFPNAHGFIVVSEPAPHCYVNVGSGCLDPASDECRWYHSPSNGSYVMVGSAASVCQVVSTGRGVLQFTIGYLDGDCCESIFGVAEGSGSLCWPVSGGTAACFIHTVTNGSLAVTYVSIGSEQEVRGYDHHSMVERLENSGEVIPASAGIGALMLDNSGSGSGYVFELRLVVTDWHHVGLNIGYVDVRSRPSAPAVMLGGESVAWEALPRGACEDAECTANETDGVGRTDGVPTASDGDPIYESDPTSISSAALIAIFVGLMVVVAFVVGVSCFVCRRTRYRRDDQLDAELDEHAIEIIPGAPMIQVANEQKAYPDISGPPPPTRSYAPPPPTYPVVPACPYPYGAPAPAAEMPEPQVPYPGCPPTYLSAGRPVDGPREWPTPV